MLSMLMTTEYAPAEECRELRQLLLRVAGGDRDALAELYQRTRSAVYGLTLSYLKNSHDAQDLTQDVYVQVWDCAAQYRPTGSPMGWLLTVCRNLCLMRLRRSRPPRRSSRRRFSPPCAVAFPRRPHPHPSMSPQRSVLPRRESEEQAADRRRAIPSRQCRRSDHQK